MNFEIVNPSSTNELLEVIRQFSSNNFRFVAGGTDLLLELRKNPEENLTVINLSQVKDEQFTEINKTSGGLRIGARLTAHKIVTNEEIKKSFPVLYESALNLASTQIRQVATVGGNLCTASPSGDIACALMALNAACEILDENGAKRIIPIQKFFAGVRRTTIKNTELLYGINIPLNNKSTERIFSGFIKVGTRKSMECSVVSLAYHIQTTKRGRIIFSGIAIGASAPTIRFTEIACDFLNGKNIYEISETEKKDFAQIVLQYASPITDIRASAWYRETALFNISKSIFENLNINER